MHSSVEVVDQVLACRFEAHRAIAGASLSSDRMCIVLEHRMLAKRIAKAMLKKWRSYYEPDELQSIVDIALCEAARAYRPEVGAKFSTFYFYHLKGRLVREIVRQRAQRKLSAARLPQMLASGDEHEEPSLEALGKEPNRLSPEIDAVAGPDDVYYRKQLLDLSNQALATLGELEREIIRQLYFHGETSVTVARKLGYSRGHVSRLHSRAIKKLRRFAERSVRSPQKQGVSWRVAV